MAYHPQPISARVVRKRSDKGFLFVLTDDGREVFVHASACRGCSFEELEDGQQVVVIPERNDKGWRSNRLDLAIEAHS